MRVSGSDAIGYDEAIEKGLELIKTNSNPNFGFLLICGVNFGLRISDLLPVTYDQLKSGKFVIGEKKTKKKRKIVVNNIVRQALEQMPDTPAKDLGGKVFTSNKGDTYSIQHVNRLLKKHFKSQKNRKISSHSLRKGFGRRYYEQSENKEVALIRLQMQFNHTTPEITSRYIGVTQEHLDSMYLEIE